MIIMRIKFWLVTILFLLNLKTYPYLYQIDNLNKESKEIFLFYDVHFSNDNLGDSTSYSLGMGKGLYKGLNLQQAFHCINNIKRNYNPKNCFIIVEDATSDNYNCYPDLLRDQKICYFGSNILTIEYINYLAQFERFPFVRNVEFRNFRHSLEFLKSIERKYDLNLIPSNIERIVDILNNVLNELLTSPSRTIFDIINNEYLPQLNELIFNKVELFKNNSLSFFLKNIDLRELTKIINKLIDFRVLNIILSNPEKTHFVFLGGNHCERIKYFLEKYYYYNFNQEKSYKELEDNPINVQKYFSNIFTYKKKLISKL